MKFHYYIFLTALVFIQIITGGDRVSAGELSEDGQHSFLTTVFGQSPPEPDYIWQTPAIRQKTGEILQRPYPGVRFKFWAKNNDTAWILKGVAKHKPVVAGIVIRDREIIRLDILVHDSRWGHQVRNPDFTNQFIGAACDDNSNLTIEVDGISGATLSVSEITRLASLALFLNNSRL